MLKATHEPKTGSKHEKIEIRVNFKTISYFVN